MSKFVTYRPTILVFTQPGLISALLSTPFASMRFLPEPHSTLSCAGPSWFPIQFPEVVAVEKLYAHIRRARAFPLMPRHAGVCLSAVVRPHHPYPLVSFDSVLALHQSAVAANHSRLRLFFPGPVGLFRAHPNRNGRDPARAPSQMTAECSRAKEEVEKPVSLELIEVLCRLVDMVRLPHALLDEPPRRLRDYITQTILFEPPVVRLQLGLAGGDKVLATKGSGMERSGGYLFALRDTALLYFRHCSPTEGLRMAKIVARFRSQIHAG